MNYFYHSLWIVCVTINFCVGIVNLRLMLETYITSRMNRMIEENRTNRRSQIIIEREANKNLYMLNH